MYARHNLVCGILFARKLFSFSVTFNAKNSTDFIIGKWPEFRKDLLKKIMAEKTLQFISTKMKNLDICMLTTTSARGILSARPMSNNGDVKYEGDSYFLAMKVRRKLRISKKMHQ
jgi:hypothetical protein